jgi:hypothetical protein
MLSITNATALYIDIFVILHITNIGGEKMSKILGKIILAGFSVIALVILTTAVSAGYTGSAGLELSGTTQVSFTTASANWGTGYVTVGGTTCTLDTEGTTTGCTNFTAVSTPLVIENIGSRDVILELASSKDAATFIGGTGSTFEWKMTAGESGSCTGITPGAYTTVNTTSPGTQVCTTFFANNTKDALNIGLKVVIPSDAAAAEKTVTITATATAIA